MKRLILISFLMMCVLCASAEARSGAIVFMRAGGARGAGDALRGAASAAGAEVVKVYERLSEHGAPAGLVASDVMDGDELVRKLSRDPAVDFVMPDAMVRAAMTPSVPDWSRQWNMKSIGLERAWDTTTGDGSIYVAVVDTGIRADHPAFGGRVAASLGANFTSRGGSTEDDNGHGTHVAGIIGAGLSGRVVGVCPNVKLIPIKILDSAGTGGVAGILDALDHITGLITSDDAVPIAAVNMSLGFYSDRQPESMARGLGRVFKTISELPGAPLIAIAAGNEGVEVGAPIQSDITASDGSVIGLVGEYVYPASLTLSGIDGLVAVSALAENGAAVTSTNWSSRAVQVAAPGSRIYSTTIASKGDHETMSGTSMATAHVSGLAALIASRTPGWTAQGLLERICATADRSKCPSVSGADEPLVVPGHKISMYGTIDADRAINWTDAQAEEAASVKPTAIALRLVSPYGSTAVVGSDYRALVIPTPEYADCKVEWSVSDSAIAAIDENGVLTPKKAGSVTITAKSPSGAVSSFDVTISQSAPARPSEGGSGGGCAAGAAAAALLAIAVIARAPKMTSRRRSGFTLVEIMVVVVIIGMLAALVGPRLMGQTDEARITNTRVQIKNIEQALQLYQLHNGNFPTTAQGLDALVKAPTIPPVPRNYAKGGYLNAKSVPKDAWGNDFIYISPGENGTEYDIISYGRDGREGGSGVDADISNWDD